MPFDIPGAARDWNQLVMTFFTPLLSWPRMHEAFKLLLRNPAAAPDVADLILARPDVRGLDLPVDPSPPPGDVAAA